ncbi:MAG: hypothetical protein LBV41_09335 [Cytophagaceae bacterium]|nr:hypothetical protein [Cytophagaceae bacterium]
MIYCSPSPCIGRNIGKKDGCSTSPRVVWYAIYHHIPSHTGRRNEV